MFRTTILLTFAFSSTLALAAPTVADIHRLLDEVYYTVDHGAPSPSDLTTLEASLQGALDLLNKWPGPLLCLKGDNGYYFPTSRAGKILGDSEFRAGYTKLEECRANLPEIGATIACFKRANGYFFPTDVATGLIVGSTSFRAGYTTFEECTSTLN